MMLSFKLTPSAEKELVLLQTKLVKAWGDITSLSQDEASYLHRQALISTIGASTRIENAALTDQEIEWVDTTLTSDGKQTAFESRKNFIFDKLSKDRQRSIEEVAGCREMLRTIYQQAGELFPLSEVHIRGLHHDLLRYFPQAGQHAGGYKTVPNKVVSYNHETGEQETVLDPAAPGIMTKTAMAGLVDWYNVTIKEMAWAVPVAVEFVFRFLAIHPFQDGNGRLGRGLFLLALLQAGDRPLREVVPFLTLDRHIEKNKSLYYKLLHQVSNGKFDQEAGRYQYGALVRFFIRIFDEALGDISVYRTRYANLQRLPESARKVLDSFKSRPEQLLKVGELETQTLLPRRTIQFALKNLVAKGFVQRLGAGAGSRYQLVF